MVSLLGEVPLLLDARRDQGILLLTADELLQQFVALVLLGREEVGKRSLRYENRAQKLVVVEADKLRERTPVSLLLRGLSLLAAQQIERRPHVLVFHPLKPHVPLGPIHQAVVGPKRQFAVALLSSSRQDVARVGRRQSVALPLLRRSIDLDVLVAVALLARIARRPVVERQADGVENRRFATTRGPHNTENIALAQSSRGEMDRLSLLPVEGSQVEYL